MHRPKPLLHWLTPMVAGAVPLLAYVATLAPTVTLEDSGSFIVAARFLGIAHPSGYPLWCVFAHVFTWLPVGSIAERVHLSSAVFAAATCVVVFLICHRMTGSRVGAMVSALTLGFSGVFWSQAVIAEVYTLNALFVALLIFFGARWRDTLDVKWLYTLAAVAGLALTNHTAVLLTILPVLGWAIAGAWRVVLSKRVLVRCVSLFLVGLTVYAYFPMRAHADVPLKWGEPDTIAKIWHHVRRADYLTQRERSRYLGTSHDVILHTVDAGRQAMRAMTVPVGVVALVGILRLWRTRRDIAAVCVGLIATHTLGFNMLVPARFSAIWSFEHRVFYIPAHVVLALGAAPAIAWAQHRLLDDHRRRWARRYRLAGHAIFIFAVCFLVVAPLLRGLAQARQAGGTVGRDFAADLMSVLPENTGILPMGDSAVFTCLYLKYIEGFRTDVHILSPAFGWRGERVSALFSVNPRTVAVVDAFPWLAEYQSVPFGLGYMYWRGSDLSFNMPSAELRSNAGTELLARVARSPFVDGVRSAYANYYVFAGESRLKSGNESEASKLFDLAERLNPDDSFVTYSLAMAYARLGFRSERVCSLLRIAKRQYTSSVDPSAQRYHGITAADLEGAIAVHCE